MKNVVTAKELASYLKLRKQLFALASHGNLPGFKIGNSWRFEMEEILMLLPGENRKANRPNFGDQ